METKDGENCEKGEERQEKGEEREGMVVGQVAAFPSELLLASGSSITQLTENAKRHIKENNRRIREKIIQAHSLTQLPTSPPSIGPLSFEKEYEADQDPDNWVISPENQLKEWQKNSQSRGVGVGRVLLDGHDLFECDCDYLICEFCERRVKGCGKADHYEVCGGFSIFCPLRYCGCKEMIRRRELPDHLQNCKFYYVQCPGDKRGFCSARVTRSQLLIGQLSHYNLTHKIKRNGDFLVPSVPYQHIVTSPGEEGSVQPVVLVHDVWKLILYSLGHTEVVGMALTCQWLHNFIVNDQILNAQMCQFKDLHKRACLCGFELLNTREWEKHRKVCEQISETLCWFCQKTINADDWYEHQRIVHNSLWFPKQYNVSPSSITVQLSTKQEEPS
eukprot:TRINITY_DN4268_c0_g1_i5.p1 TRINITY_DN4268_c0_g1~~TRINITY_DN4268_c0_g1_i5.p1  ORF type:complete len:389 (+),score=76.05 TRINITY_DN4268_c0_g1_i5:269-1435(+)